MDNDERKGCVGCRVEGAELPELAMAFQPIVDLHSGDTFAYEALVRGPRQEPAGAVMAAIPADRIYAFDQQCRIRALETAKQVGLDRTAALLSIKFLPKAVYNPRACIQLTLETAERVAFPTDRILFEFTETETFADVGHVRGIIETYRSLGFRTAIDDFGSGHSGLTLLADLQPDIVKLDMQLIRGIDRDHRRRAIVKAVQALSEDLGITLVAEGVETGEEHSALEDLGIRYLQGYLFARPAFMALPEVTWP